MKTNTMEAQSYMRRRSRSSKAKNRRYGGHTASASASALWLGTGTVSCSLLLFLLAASTTSSTLAAAAPSSVKQQQQARQFLENLNYAVYPIRSQDEAAVIEWGHSAVISALDAAVASFGPQTSDAALLEVETQPVLADPVNGVWDEDDGEDDKDESGSETTKHQQKRDKLDNADEVHGNVVVMTNTGLPEVSGVDLAVLAQNSGAAALVIVNVDNERPDDIYRLVPNNESEQEVAATIDIPVVVISLSSANLLTSATVTEQTPPEDIVNNGMPDRIRLYAGGDRPFFEDVEAADPTVYVIHNLLTRAECESLIRQAAPRVAPLTGNDQLQYTIEYKKFVETERVHLWQGLLQGPESKAVQERIEQVTGFPAQHLSDWTVNKLTTGSYWQTHYDSLVGNYIPMATITVFLSPTPSSENFGGEIVFPNTKTEPVKIRPVQGMAVVHHNTNEDHKFDAHSLHALLPIAGGDSDTEFYVATKYILPMPATNARRIALPVFAVLSGGRLPRVIVTLHDLLVDKFGAEKGGAYFDKVCVFVPVLLLVVLAQYVARYVHQQMTGSGSSGGTGKKTATKATPTAKTKSTLKDKKGKKRD